MGRVAAAISAIAMVELVPIRRSSCWAKRLSAEPHCELLSPSGELRSREQQYSTGELARRDKDAGARQVTGSGF